MILRKALLISAPEGGHQAGGNSDLAATRNFLLSPRGGAWAAHEIHVLDNPTVEDITARVSDMKADYTITYFSGSSFGDASGNRFLVLNGDFIRDTDLLNSSEKQLVLVDTCPDSFTGEVINFMGKPNEFELARKMYDKWIERCEAGQVIMHARESSVTDRSNAGLFTKKLLQLGSRVPPVQDKFNLKSILAAGHEIPQLMGENGEPGGPEISYSNGNIKLPFAMAMPAPRPGLPSGGGGGINAIALTMFLLGFLLSGE
jgi:hypothetical protein